MKRTTYFITLIFLFILNATSYAQEDEVSIEMLKNKIEEIEKSINDRSKIDDIIIEKSNQNIEHASDIIGIMEVTGIFITVILAILSVYVAFETKRGRAIRDKLNEYLNSINKNNIELKNHQQKLKDINNKYKDLTKVIFYLSEGDTYIDEQPEESLKYYKEALKINDDIPDIYVKIGYAHVRIGEYKNAIEILEKGHSKRTDFERDDHVGILNGLARAYRKIENYNVAEKYYKDVLKIDPNYSWSQSGLCQVYMHQGELKSALQLAKVIEATDKESAYYSRLNLGIIYICLGGESNIENGEEVLRIAGKNLEKRMKRSPLDSRLNINQTIIYLGLKEIDSAKVSLNEGFKKSIYKSQIVSLYDRLKLLINNTNDAEYLVFKQYSDELLKDLITEHIY